MDRERKRSSGPKWLGAVLYALLGAAAAIPNMRYIFRFPQLSAGMRMLLFFLLLLTVYVTMFLQIVLHEAGHLIFGLATGYRFSSFRIHSWMWVREDGKLRLKRLNIPGTGGQCLMGPPDLQNGRIPVLLYNFGGAILNLVTAVLFLFLSSLFGPSSFFRLFFQQLALFGAGLALVNGLPLRIGSVDNDGRNALNLMKNEKAVHAFWLQMKVNEQVARGVRIGDMPDDWFTVPEDSDMKDGLVAAVGVLSASRLMDQRRFAVADALMAHLLSIESGITDLHRSLLTGDRIFLELIGQNRREVLDDLLSKEQKELMKAMGDSPSVLRTEYAYALLAQGDPAKAEKIRERFEKCAVSYPYPCEIPGERELMQTALERFQAEEEEAAPDLSEDSREEPGEIPPE